ncbi:MAG: transposase [Clostridia bacterium]|nr:transposase [Clostridia bacterium]
MEKELPKRKSTRMRCFDYATTGAYFVTICTQNRKNTLSSIVGEGFPLPQLSRCGEIANKWIRELPKKYKEISVECYVIMPNHIHLLLLWKKEDGRGDPSPTIVTAIGWLKYQITREINISCHTVGEKVFQRSFYDHVIRSDKDYTEIYQYICENPMRWQLDKLYTPE